MAEHNHHHHGHDHGHDHSHDKDAAGSLLERNRAHWNQQAPTYNSKHTQQEFGDLINKVTTFILANISWIGVDFLDPATTFEKPSAPAKPSAEVRVLDYACGPGTMTAIFAGRASEFVGVDFSENMVEEYNKRFDSGNSGEDINAHAIVGNLFAEEGPPEALSGAKFTNFDLVVVGLGFHHFDNLEQVTARLADRVKPGGALMIVDFLPHAKNDLGDDVVHIIAHHGFTEDRVRALFEGAGLTNFGIRTMDEPVMLRGTAPRTIFIARAQKPA